MIITNQKQAVNQRIQKVIVLLILVIMIGLIYFTNAIPRGALGFSREQITVGILIMIFAFFLYDYMRNYNYLYYTDTGDKLILRYYSLRPFDDKKNAIEFSKSELERFELQKTRFGINEYLVIYRKTGKGLAKYPPVSITALAADDREKMISSLLRLIRQNRDNKQ
jgi:hypothetical protein